MTDGDTTMLPQEIIRHKRDGQVLTRAEIDHFVHGLVHEQSWGDAQVGSMAMACFLKGLNQDEKVALTLAMMRSGEVLSWAEAQLPGPVLDKHSTGGVGDKVSLPLAPILAACGAYVPMISGRGLGHTGGTLDKFDSIPGYTTAPSVEHPESPVDVVGDDGVATPLPVPLQRYDAIECAGVVVAAFDTVP